jgi:YegS/Rv2252/BmrU family lipid kinase
VKIKFVIKPFSKKRDGELFREELLKLKEGGGIIEESPTSSLGENSAQILAKRAFEKGFNIIIFVGGDGILNEGLNGIMQASGGHFPPDFCIGIIPTGSGNNFAKALKIPKDFKKAFSIIKEGKIIPVDIGKVNNRFFINCLSFGFDAQINRLTNELKSKHSFLPKEGSYLFATIKEIIKEIPLFEMKIESKEKYEKRDVILLAITNGPSYGAIFKVNPEASYNDGKFDVCIVNSVGKLRAFYDILKVIRGTHSNLPEIEMFRTSDIIISSETPLPYEMDGEVFEPQKEYKISLIPKILRVLV